MTERNPIVDGLKRLLAEVEAGEVVYISIEKRYVDGRQSSIAYVDEFKATAALRAQAKESDA